MLLFALVYIHWHLLHTTLVLQSLALSSAVGGRDTAGSLLYAFRRRTTTAPLFQARLALLRYFCRTATR